MGTIERDHKGIEDSPFQETCPRHGAKLHRYRRCPKCVIEEVRRHERRIHVPFEHEAWLPADSMREAAALNSETA